MKIRPGLPTYPSDRAGGRVVNRTRRIVREQALAMNEQRRQKRSLLAPVAICSILLALIFYAFWAGTAGYDLTPGGIPDASDQMFLLVLWSMPVTIVLLGITWIRRRRGGGEPAA